MTGRLALLAASIVATLVVLELGCRVVRGRHYLWHWPNLVLDSREGSVRYYQTVMSPNPEIGLVPRSSLAHAHGTHDDRGLRVTPATGAIADRPLILATGGSFTYGDEVADAETWPSALQQRLGIRVVNGGAPTHGFDQVVMRTERLARMLQPDVIAVSVNEDNVRRNELSRFAGLPKPYFTREGDRLALHNSPVPPPPSAPTLAWWEHAFGWSMLLDTVLDRLEWPEDWPYDTVRSLPQGAGQGMVCPLMKRLAALAIPVLVLVQYDPWEDDEDTARERRAAAAILRCAEAAGLATLDTFDAVAPDGDLRRAAHLFQPEAHYNAEGNALIATAVANRLQQLGWLSHRSR